jgi:chromosome segregation ATPase
VSESWPDYQAPHIRAVTSVEEVEEQTTSPVEVPSASPADDEAPQTNAVTTEQGVGTQASQHDQKYSGHVDELQQLLEQLQATQQQLQGAEAQLQAAKEHEVQLQTAREREQQLQTARQQLQDMQVQLQATLAELRETQARIEHYQ